MRKLIIVVVGLAPLLAAPMGCQRKQPVKVEVVEEDAPKLATVVHVADPRATVQLVKGFYELEQGSWRWTASKFAVALRPPRGALERGVTLQLKFAIAEAVLGRVKSMTLKARSGKVDLGAETYSESGEHVYAREVPASILGGEVVLFEFEVDKFLPPGAVEQRELALIVTTVGLELK
jgi:hypothetical protein